MFITSSLDFKVLPVTPGPGEQDKIKRESQGLLLPLWPSVQSSHVSKMFTGNIASLIKIRRALSSTGAEESCYNPHDFFILFKPPNIDSDIKNVHVTHSVLKK